MVETKLEEEEEGGEGGVEVFICGPGTKSFNHAGGARNREDLRGAAMPEGEAGGREGTGGGLQTGDTVSSWSPVTRGGLREEDGVGAKGAVSGVEGKEPKRGVFWPGMD